MVDVQRLGYFEDAARGPESPCGSPAHPETRSASSPGYDASMKRIEGLVSDEWGKALSAEHAQQAVVRIAC